jgi:ABC-type amino acid transport substrate-binding protein
MIETDKDGKLTGFDIELARAIAKRLEVEVEFLRTAETYDGVVELVAKGEADIAVSYLSRTTKRAKLVYFTDPYLVQSVTLLINRTKAFKYPWDCPSIDEVRELIKTPGLIGILKKGAYATWAKRLPDASVKVFDSAFANMSAVLKGEILGSLQGEVQARDFLDDDPAAAIRLKLCEIGKRKDYIAIAVRPDAPNLWHWLNVFLANRTLVFTTKDIFIKKGAWDF